MRLSRPKLNPAGFRRLRTGSGAQRWVSDAAERIAAAASRTSGENYEVREQPGRQRARVIVVPATPEAARDSITNLTLLRSLDAGQ